MENAQDPMSSMFNKWSHLPQLSSFPSEYSNILTHMITDISRANTQAINDFMKSNSDHMHELSNSPNKAMNILSDWSCKNTEQFHQHSMSILDTLFKSAIEYQRMIANQTETETEHEHEHEHELESNSKSTYKKQNQNINK